MTDARRRLLTALRMAIAICLLTPASGRLAAQEIDALLARPPFSRALWGVVLVDERGRVLYARNADKLFMPASVTKLLVTSVAAARLPADWTVRTSLYAAGPVDAGTIRGDLVLYGRGDPTFSRRCFAVDTTAPGACERDPSSGFRRLASQLKARGITRIEGDVVGDGSWFEPTGIRGTWQSYDLNWWYAAPVSGLGFNDNSLEISWRPGPTVGAPLAIDIQPAFAGITLDNRTETAPPGTRQTLDFFRYPGTLRLWAEGKAAGPATGQPPTEYFAHPDPSLFAAQALRAALEDSGIVVTGAVRSTLDSTATQAARARAPLAEVTSRPLRDWLFPILNVSQNLFAEMLLKQLGRQFAGAGSWEAGIDVERRFLIDSMGVDSTQFRVTDGSGLSTSNLLTPLALVTVLRYLRQHPSFDTFAAGLPRSGQVGSLRRRFVDTPLEGKVRAKTGSINGVNTLAGYIELPERTLTFAVMVNHHTAPSREMLAAIDSVVVRLARMKRPSSSAQAALKVRR
ncbi:MAG: D-alanyl-D-alanine carboxypeptidase/D-alanyl-D-alanine endopeptidase [Gemmatimonadota bacterium]